MADPIPAEVAKVEAAVVAAVPTVKAKIVAYVKSHATPTVLGTIAGFAAGKFHVVGLIWKLL